MARIALIPGDGIGREVIREARRLLEALSRAHGLELEMVSWNLGAERFLREGVTISEEEFRSLADDHDAILLGALGDPRVEDNRHARDILLGLRFRLDLYVNYRPNRLAAPELSPLRTVAERAHGGASPVPPSREGASGGASDAGTTAGGLCVEIFRENTEGAYAGIGGTLREGTGEEVALQEEVHTHRGVERLIRAAFQHARERGRESVTLVDKANALPHAGGLWRRTFAEVAGEYPEVEVRRMYVDAMAQDLVRRPEDYHVVATSNLFGDILSDLAAEVTGGLGMAASANLHPGRHALFEPVHGSAPDIAGTGRANPMGALRCVGLLLEHFGHGSWGERVEEAVAAAVREGVTTPDLGGGRTTEEVGRWVVERVVGDGGI